MRTALFILLTLSSAMFAQSARIEEVGKSPVEAKFVTGGRIHMDLCSSGVDVVGSNEPTVRVSYDRDAPDVRVRLQVSGDRASVRVTGCPHNNFRVRIEIPKSSALHVRMFAGELNVRDVTGDKDVVLHFGQLTMDIGNRDEYARVDASVNSGELDAVAYNVNKGGLFRSFDQSGPGKYRLYAHVGAGQLDLR